VGLPIGSPPAVASLACSFAAAKKKVKGFLALLMGFSVLGGCSSGKTARAIPPVTTARAVITAPVGNGPVANVDHWHGAYGVFDCDRYLDPVDGSEFPDPDGIHTHADGLIHIHPFTAGASGANATLQRFADVLGIAVTKDRLFVKSSTPSLDRRTGDKCANGKVGRVRVIQFAGKTHTEQRELTEPLNLPLRKDQVIAFVFAPDDQLIGPPPSLSELDAPADVPIEFELTPERLKIVGKRPTFELPKGDKPSKLVIEDLELGTGPEVGETSKVGIKYLLGTWSSGKVTDSNWEDSQPLFGLLLGRELVVKGFEQGIQGMKVGGLRRITIPPDFGFGSLGSPPGIGPNETLVLYVRLVALEVPKFNVVGTTLPA
jgi:peptidylprolyl isomerase